MSGIWYIDTMSYNKKINQVLGILVMFHVLQACEVQGTPSVLTQINAIQAPVVSGGDDDSTPAPQAPAQQVNATAVCMHNAWSCEEMFDQNFDHQIFACSWITGTRQWEDNTQDYLNQAADTIKAGMDDQLVISEETKTFDFEAAETTGDHYNQNIFQAPASDQTQVRVFVDDVSLVNHFSAMVFVEILDSSMTVSASCEGN